MDQLDLKEKEVQEEAASTPLDKNVRLMSPNQMLVRRFFRSKLSVVGLVMVISLFLFCFAGPLIYTAWGETELDKSGKVDYSTSEYTYTVDGVTYTVHQTTEKKMEDNFLSAPSLRHPLGTDDQGYDVLARLMYGGRVSLLVSFLTVFLLTIFGVLLGGTSHSRLWHLKDCSDEYAPVLLLDRHSPQTDCDQWLPNNRFQLQDSRPN